MDGVPGIGHALRSTEGPSIACSQPADKMHPLPGNYLPCVYYEAGTGERIVLLGASIPALEETDQGKVRAECTRARLF